MGAFPGGLHSVQREVRARSCKTIQKNENVKNEALLSAFLYESAVKYLHASAVHLQASAAVHIVLRFSNQERMLFYTLTKDVCAREFLSI